MTPPRRWRWPWCGESMFALSKEDTELASARDAIWLARRSLEENNAAQALINLEVARLRLRVYREVLSQDQRKEVDQMLAEIEQLEGQLRHDKTQPASRAERARQGHRSPVGGTRSIAGSSGTSDQRSREPCAHALAIRAGMRHTPAFPSP